MLGAYPIEKRSSVSVAQLAFREVRPGHLRLASLNKDFAVPADRRLERLPQTPPMPILLRGALRELDPCPLREAGQRLAEIEAVTLHEEGEDVAPLPQPKQCHVSRSGVTTKEGVFSAWNGQRPL